MAGWEDDVFGGSSAPARDPFADDPFDRVKLSIIGQESTDKAHPQGNYSAVGEPTKWGRALGRYQVIPAKVSEWSRKYLGRDVSPDEYLKTPALQDEIAHHALRDYWDQALAHTKGNVDQAVRRTAAAWYSGDPDLGDSTTGQVAGGHAYPSIAGYAASVSKRFRDMGGRSHAAREQTAARPELDDVFDGLTPPTSAPPASTTLRPARDVLLGDATPAPPVEPASSWAAPARAAVNGGVLTAPDPEPARDGLLGDATPAPPLEPSATPALSHHVALAPDEEATFQAWYRAVARQRHLDPNPDAPEHHYDYRAAWKAGAGPGAADGHWPSKFKDPDHPRRYGTIGGKVVDTITGEEAPPGTVPGFDADAEAGAASARRPTTLRPARDVVTPERQANIDAGDPFARVGPTTSRSARGRPVIDVGDVVTGESRAELAARTAREQQVALEQLGMAGGGIRPGEFGVPPTGPTLGERYTHDQIVRATPPPPSVGPDHPTMQAMPEGPSTSYARNLAGRVVEHPIASAVFPAATMVQAGADTGEGLIQQGERQTGEFREHMLPDVFGTNLGRAALDTAPAVAAGLSLDNARPRARLYGSVPGALDGLPELAVQAGSAAGEAPYYVIPGVGEETLAGRIAENAVRMGVTSELSGAPLENPNETPKQKRDRVRAATLLGAVLSGVEKVIPHAPFAAADAALEDVAPDLAGLGARGHTAASMVGAGYAVPALTGEEMPGVGENVQNALIGAAIGPSGYEPGAARRARPDVDAAARASFDPSRAQVRLRPQFDAAGDVDANPEVPPTPPTRPAGADGVPTSPEPAGPPHSSGAARYADPTSIEREALRRAHDIRINRAEDPEPDTDFQHALADAYDTAPNDVVRLNGHGMARTREGHALADLEQILDGRLEPGRTPDEGPLDPTKPPGQGGMFDHNVPFVLLSKPDTTIREHGIGAVVVNETYDHAIPYLEQRYPGVPFVRGRDFAARLPELVEARATSSASPIVEPILDKQPVIEPAETGVTPAETQDPADTSRGDFDAGVASTSTARPTGNVRSEDFPLDQLKTDPDRFQYKLRRTGKHGASGSLEGVTRWDEKNPDRMQVWEDPADGQVYVVNGHNRYALADRAENRPSHVKVDFIDEPTADLARARGALTNIQQGNGEPVDVAKFLRDTGSSPETLAGHGINMRQRLVTEGVALSRLDEFLWHQVLRGELPEDIGAIIGRHIENPDLQRQAYKLISKERNPSKELATEIAEGIGRGPTSTRRTETLFGTEESTESLIVERARAAAHIKAELGTERAAFSGANRHAGRLTEAGNDIDVSANAERAREAGDARAVFDKLKNAAGPISDILDTAARRLHDGERPETVYSDSLERVRAAVSDTLGRSGRTDGKQGPHGDRQGGSTKTGRDRGRPGGARPDARSGVDLEAPPPLVAPPAPDGAVHVQGSPARDLPGAPSGGRSTGRIAIAPLEGGAPKRIREIWTDFEKKVGRVRVGKTERGVAGYFDPSSMATIVARPGDLDVLAHEAAHRLDRQYKIAAEWKDRPSSPYDAELVPQFSQHGSPAPMNHPNPRSYERAEGVAEFVRGYAVDPAEARRRAPRFAAYFERKVPEAARRAIEDLGRDMRHLAGQTPDAQALANFNLSRGEAPAFDRLRDRLAAPGGIRAKIGEYFDRTLAPKMFDDLHAAVELGQRAALRLRGMTEASLRPRQNFERLARLYKGVDAKLESILEVGMIDARGEKITPTGILDYTHEPFDRSSPEALQRDRGDAVVYGAAERVLERADKLRAEAEERAEPLQARVREVAATKIEAERASADAAEARIRERYDARIARDRGTIEGDHHEQAAYYRGREEGIAKGRGIERRRAIDELGEAADPSVVSTKRGAITRIERAADRRITSRDARARARTQVRTDMASSRLKEIRDRAVARVREVEARHVEKIEAARDEAVERVRARLVDAAGRQASRIAGIGVGLVSDVTQARRILERVGQDPKREAKAKEAMRRYREVADDALRYMVDKGRISKDAYQAIKEWNNYYLAFNRTFDEYESLGEAYRRSGGKLGRARETVRRQVGGTGEIEDPYFSLFTKVGDMVKEADRNEAMRAFIDLVDVPRAMYDGEPLDFSSIARRARPGDEGTIRVFRPVKKKDADGKARETIEEQHWQVTDPDIHAALTSIDGGTPADWVLAVSGAAKVLRAGVTYSPGFVARNFLRDPLQRFVASNVDSNPFAQLKRFDPETKRRFEVSGGDQAGAYLYDRPSYDALLSKQMRELAGGRGPVKTIVAMPGKLLDGWKAIAEQAERQGRLAEFEAAYRHGKEKLGYDDYDATLYAGSEARGLLDYAVAGSAVRDLNRIIPFLNAGIQGLRRSGRAVAERPGRTAAKWALSVVVPRALAALWNLYQGDEKLEEYRQLPAYQRDMFLNLKLGPNTWLALPQPFELGTAGAGVERLVEAIATREPGKALEGYGGDAVKSLLPVDPDSLIAGPLGPVVQAIANYDFFRDRSIVPPNEANVDLELREGTSHASRLGKIMQKAVGIDARKADFLIRSQFGGVGGLVADVSDLGRDDKRSTLELAENATGLLRSSPAYAARDVQWVLERARGRDEVGSPAVKELLDALKTYQEAKDPRERDQLAADVRDRAKGLRETYEAAGSFLTPAERARREANASARDAKTMERDEERRRRYGAR